MNFTSSTRVTMKTIKTSDNQSKNRCKHEWYKMGTILDPNSNYNRIEESCVICHKTRRRMWTSGEYEEFILSRTCSACGCVSDRETVHRPSESLLDCIEFLSKKIKDLEQRLRDAEHTIERLEHTTRDYW